MCFSILERGHHRGEVCLQPVQMEKGIKRRMAHLTIKSNEPTFHARENVSDYQKEKRLEEMSHGHYLYQLHRNHDRAARPQKLHRSSAGRVRSGYGVEMSIPRLDHPISRLFFPIVTYAGHALDYHLLC